MTDLELGEIQIETSAEDGDTIKEVLAARTSIEKLMYECYEISIREKTLKNELDDKRNELKKLIAPLGIGKIITTDFTMSHIASKRFNGWKDEEAVIELIKHRGFAGMSPDRSKIEALVKAKDVPKEVLELEDFKETKSIRFTPIVDKIQTD